MVHKAACAAGRKKHGDDSTEHADDNGGERGHAHSGQEHDKGHDGKDDDVVNDYAGEYDLPYFQAVE